MRVAHTPAPARLAEMLAQKKSILQGEGSWTHQGNKTYSLFRIIPHRPERAQCHSPG